MPRTLLNDHPPDVQLCIIEEVDSPKDLLSLALTSKYYYRLIVPAHIQSRILRIPVQRADVWATLASRKHLCERIRILDLTYRRIPIDPEHPGYLIPSSVVDEVGDINTVYRLPLAEDEEHCEADIQKALVPCQWMSRLQAFRWNGGLHARNNEPLYDILRVVLQSAEQLQSLEVYSSRYASWEYTPINYVASKHIKRVAIFWPSVRNPPTENHHILLDVLIQHCPQLQDLEANVPKEGPHFLSKLLGASWPRLIRFTISNFHFGGDSNVNFSALAPSFGQFIKNHTSIQRLYIAFPSLISPEYTDFSQLSHLRALAIPQCPYPDLMFHTSLPENIELLEFGPDIFSRRTFSLLPRLHSVIMRVTEEQDACTVLDCLPSTIRYLSLQPCMELWENTKLLRSWIEALDRFPQLTHLGGILCSRRDSFFPLHRLVKTAPSLEYIQLLGPKQRRICTRDGEFIKPFPALWFKIVKMDEQSELRFTEDGEVSNVIKDGFFAPFHEA